MNDGLSKSRVSVWARQAPRENVFFFWTSAEYFGPRVSEEFIDIFIENCLTTIRTFGSSKHSVPRLKRPWRPQEWTDGCTILHPNPLKAEHLVWLSEILLRIRLLVSL